MDASVKNTMKISEGNPLSRWFHNRVNYFDAHVFGMMIKYMIIQSCLGGVTACFVHMNHGSDLVICTSVALSMGCNATLLAQAGGKINVIAYITSIVLNSLILIAHI
jgi:hypothetical protein